MFQTDAMQHLHVSQLPKTVPQDFISLGQATIPSKLELAQHI
jgi:hypothetical protein